MAYQRGPPARVIPRHVSFQVSPTWDKFYDGRSFTPLRNAREFASMASCCGSQIKAVRAHPSRNRRDLPMMTSREPPK